MRSFHLIGKIVVLKKCRILSGRHTDLIKKEVPIIIYLNFNL